MARGGGGGGRGRRFRSAAPSGLLSLYMSWFQVTNLKSSHPALLKPLTSL